MNQQASYHQPSSRAETKKLLIVPDERIDESTQIFKHSSRITPAQQLVAVVQLLYIA